MSTSEIIVLVYSIVMILPTLASLTRLDQWWIRGFDFPRLQICALIILGIIASVVFYTTYSALEIIVFISLCLSLVYQFNKIYPYTFLARKQVIRCREDNPADTISLLVSNVLTPNKRSDKLLKLVKEKEPDILLTLETDERWEKELSVLEETYQYTVKIPQDNLYGMHLYSKLRLENTEVKYLVQEDIPSIHSNVIMKNGKKLKIHCLHPMPPSPTESDTSTNRDAELLMVGRHIKENDKGILVLGDLNDVAWSRTTRLFQKMSGLLDPRIGRGFFNTFHAEHPLLRWPLDHVFHSKDFSLIEITREWSIGSDHFPIYIKLCYKPELENKQEKPEKNTQEEEEWADEKIKDAKPLEASF